jgi:hypothetical protein
MDDNMKPTSIAMIEMVTAKWTTHLLYLAVELDLAETLKDGPLKAEEVARRVSANPDITYRILRALASIGVLHESADKRFALNAQGRLLCADEPESIKHIVRMVGAPWHNRMWEAISESARTGRSGADHAFGMTLWGYLDAHPEQLENFNAAMTEVSNTIGAYALEAYDFSAIETLVDVGGGHGRLLSRVLQRYPKLQGIVFDRPPLAEGARTLLAERGLTDRCQFVGGDFLKAVPPGGSAYMLSNVLHNWSDAEAVTILKNCRAAMKPRTKLLIFSGVIGAPNEPEWCKLMDVEMLAMFGGRDRTPDEFAQLFKEGGFVLERVVSTRSTSRIVEGSAH